MAGRYQPIRATPHPPFDVSLHVGVAWVATTAVVVHLASLSLVMSAASLALSIVLAALLGRRWRRQVGADPQRDLYKVLFAPMWGAGVLLLAVIVAATVLGGELKPAPPGGVVALVGAGMALPSAWAAGWFAGAAARGGPTAPGTRPRARAGRRVAHDRGGALAGPRRGGSRR